MLKLSLARKPRLETSLRYSHNGNFRLEERLIENVPSVIVEGYNRDQFTNEVETGNY
jgi:hypothetical protein